MNWKKSLSIVGTLIMVVGQNIAGVTAFAETISNQESIVEDIYFEKDNTKISEITLEQGKEETITFVDENKEDEEAIVTLPESTKLNLTETNLQLGDASIVNYNEDTNQVKIAFKNKEQNIKRTNLILVTNDTVENNQARMYAQVIRQDSQTYMSKPVIITTTTSSENNKQQEETQKNEEDGESAQQSIPNNEVPTLRSGNANVDLDISSVTDSVLAGEDLVYALNFKVTGSQTIYHNAKISVNIPLGFNLNQDLSQIQIAGVIPTFDSTKGLLMYEFPELKSGQAYTVNLKVGTVNGTTPNGTEVKLTADFSADEFSGNAKSEATEMIKASSSLATSKAYVKTVDSSGKEKTTPPTAGDVGTWNIKISAAKKSTGLLYLKEGSKITIVDTLPEGMTYISDNLDGKYDESKKTITWQFDAPTLSEQELAQENLFNKELTVTVKFESDIKNYQVFKNVVHAEAIRIDDQTVSSDTSANVMAGISDPTNTEVPPGKEYLPYHVGPKKDGKESSADNPNPDATFYDSRIINFRFGVVPWMANSRDKDFDSYEITYKIDSHLNLRNLYIPKFNYSPDASINENKTLYPKGEIFVTIDGKEKKLTDFVTPENNSKIINLNSLGIPEGTHIQSFRINFTEYPAGAVNYQGITMDYSIEKGYVGDIENNVFYDVHGYTAKNKAIHWSNDSNKNPDQNPGNYDILKASSGYRTAHVIAPPANSIPVVKSEIHFNTSNNGIVQPGNNRITGYFGVDGSSAQSITKPITAMVLLPVGVKVDLNNPQYKLNNNVFWDEDTIDGNNENGKVSIITNDYSDSGRQLIKVEWNVTKLSFNDGVSYAFNTIIDKDAPTPLRMDTYGFSGDDKLSVPSGASTLTDSYLETNTDNLDGSGNTTKPRVQSANQYRMVKENQITTEKLVKGEQDKEYGKMGHTSPGGKIDYQLNMTNKGNTIGNFVMMDVLPSIDDLGITDNTSRDSKFTPELQGPISVSNDWKGKVTVLYSESTNPSRKDLDSNVNYPSSTNHLVDPENAQTPNWKSEGEVSDWSKIHSFMIQLNAGEWTKGDKVSIEFSMKAPINISMDLLNQQTPDENRAAWNSFAYTANNSQVVEPERVGVVINGENPNIDKDVEGKEHLDLTNRDDEFNWHVNAAFGNTTASWEQASIKDKINDVFGIVKVTVVDENGKDVTGNGTLSTENNEVVFEINKKDDSYTYLAGHTYTMTITTKIKDSVTDEELAPYIKDGGIPNQADLEFGNKGDVIHSEKPTVTPP
ncbi:isopeptide-forming domain-containing fimbrial protein, partial [Enterococcus faecalis]|uniref:isopeptide-forming domain-containing fimbrial protein n=1 Tax=Enterococcus faecalis TaxID=1351 RepID=UPI001F0332D0